MYLELPIVDRLTLPAILAKRRGAVALLLSSQPGRTFLTILARRKAAGIRRLLCARPAGIPNLL